MMHQVANGDTTDPTYQGLYKYGGAAALIAAVLILGEVFFFAIYPQPGTITDWFTLFQNHPLVGLLDMWGIEVLMYLMFIVMFLALYMALRSTNPSLMVIALTFAMVGIAIFLATNNPVSMLSLTRQYTAAATEAERSTFLAAGQALLTNTTQRAVGGFNMGLFLVSAAGLMVSSVMLQGNTFSRSTAIVGIVAHGLALADYLRQALTSSVIAALLLIVPGALFLVIWHVQVGRRLYQLGRSERTTLSR